MKNKNLFFHNGEGAFENHQIMLNGERLISIKDSDSEFVVDGIKNIEIKYKDENRVKIILGSKAIFYSKNKKIVVNDTLDNISIEVVGSEDRMKEFQGMVNAQEAEGLIDYIVENAPNIFTKEHLEQQTLDELKQIKEKLDDLANCY